MTITLVVPTYNEAPFLRRCLDSIKNQIVKFDEVIIVDDGSTDGSGEILEEYRGRFTVLYDVNRGVSHARNAGIQQATSQYITFLDADDELTPDACAIMHRAIEKFPRADAIQFNHLRHYAALKKTVRKYTNISQWFDISDLGRINIWFGVWNKVYKAKSLPWFDESINYGEDGLINLEMLADDKRFVCYEAETVVHHFENPCSLTRIKSLYDVDKQEQAYRGLLAKHIDDKWVVVRGLFDAIEELHASESYKRLGWKLK